MFNIILLHDDTFAQTKENAILESSVHDGACSRAELSSKWHMSAKIASTRAALQSPFLGHNLTTHCYLVGGFNPSEKNISQLE